MTDPRSLEGSCFHRRTADPALLAASATWQVWTCDDAEFRHTYDRGVTLCVDRGAAVLHFADGSEVDLRPGDTLTIRQGARAVWTITAPIRNLYQEHDA